MDIVYCVRILSVPREVKTQELASWLSSSEELTLRRPILTSLNPHPRRRSTSKSVGRTKHIAERRSSKVHRSAWVWQSTLQSVGRANYISERGSSKLHRRARVEQTTSQSAGLAKYIAERGFLAKYIAERRSSKLHRTAWV